MRPSALVAALIVACIPTVSAAAGDGLSLTGPSSLTTTGATSVPLLVGLTLDNVRCVQDVELPVHLSIARATGARAELVSERVSFRLAAHSTLARGWTGDAYVSMLVEPQAARGIVEILARYQIPTGCTVVGGGPTSGEARHILETAQARPEAPPAPLPSIGVFESTKVEADDTHVGLQAAIVGTILGGVAVVVKRVRNRAA